MKRLACFLVVSLWLPVICGVGLLYSQGSDGGRLRRGANIDREAPGALNHTAGDPVPIGTHTVEAYGDTLGGVAWYKDPQNPVISGGGLSGYMHAMNPCVVYNADSARFEMWFNQGPSSVWYTRPWHIGYATSTDGSTWMQYPSAVLSPTPGTWDANTVDCPTVIREDGTYKMWYSSFVNFSSPGYIGYATSPNGINWTKHAGNPVFDPGTATWEAGGLYSCSVMPVPGGYKMWYDAYNSLLDVIRIGYATSIDGIVWERDTVHNPILSQGTSVEWDGQGVAIPTVLRGNINSSQVYYMWYMGVGADGGKSGLAISSDGVSGWTKSSYNPVLRPTPGAWDETDVAVASVVLYRDSLLAWYDAYRAPASTYLYRIGHAISPNPFTTAVDEGKGNIPERFLLAQNYPNPFNPSTTIRYELPHASRVNLKVYNTLGQEVATLVNEPKAAGVYAVQFDAGDLASGVYFYRLQAGNFVETKKLVVLR